MHQTCYVSGTGWLCFRIGQHSIPVFKLNDAQTREWNDAEKFVANKQENVHPVVAADGLGSMLAAFMADQNSNYVVSGGYREPVAVTIRTIENSTGCEYDLPLAKDVLNVINSQLDKLAAIRMLRNDLRFSLSAAKTLVEWLAFSGIIDGKFLGEYNHAEIFSNDRFRIFAIPTRE